MELIEGSLVLCTVKKIEKTTVFLELEGNKEGSMVLSEVAAGRIRNLRIYVYPGKKIVCKILNLENDHIELSLRRVTSKERETVLNGYKKEKSFLNMLKTIVKDPPKIIEEIKKEHDLLEFADEVKETPSILNKYFTNDESEKVLKIILEKSEKEKLVKKTFKLSSNSPSGIIDIKDILTNKDAEIHYLGSSNFSITTKAGEFKEANKKMEAVLKEIEIKAKSKKAHFEIKEK